MKQTLLALVAAATLSCGRDESSSLPKSIQTSPAITINVNALAQGWDFDYKNLSFLAREERLLQEGYTRCDGFLAGSIEAGERMAQMTYKDIPATDYEIVDRGTYEMGGMIDNTHHFVAYKKSKQ